MIHRRSFITGLISLVAAPAIVRAGSLMPVKVMVQHEFEEYRTWIVPADAVHDAQLLEGYKIAQDRLMLAAQWRQNWESDLEDCRIFGLST